MNIGGFSALPVSYMNDEEDVFDPELDDIPENGDLSESVVIHPSPGDGVIIDPNTSQNKALKLILDTFDEQNKKMKEINAKIEAGEHTLAQLSSGFAQEKDVLNQQLLNQSKKIEELKGKLDELSILQEERTQWIRDNKDSEVVIYFLKATLGTMLACVGGLALDSVGLLSLANNELRVVLGGALMGGRMGSSSENALKEALEIYENQYIKKNPSASRRDAFEHAKKEIISARMNSTNDPDHWGGIDY